jgi:DNA polymerase-3 subunit epsilon
VPCADRPEPAAEYNRRVDKAFERRRVVAWPYKGTIAIEETDPQTQESQFFFVDNWCLIGTARTAEGMERMDPAPAVRFDFDTYKILLNYIMKPSNRKSLRRMPWPSAAESLP